MGGEKGTPPGGGGGEGERKENEEGSEHSGYPPQFIGDGAEDSIGPEEVPLGHDMEGGEKGVGGDKILGVPEQGGGIEAEGGQEGGEENKPHKIFGGIIPMERHFLPLSPEAQGIVGTALMKEEEVEDGQEGGEEGEKEMEGKETIEGGIIDREAPPEPLHEEGAGVGNGGEEICDDRGASEAHLAPGQDIAYEGSGHYSDKYKNADISSLTKKEGGVINAPANMEIEAEKEKGTPVGMKGAK